MRRARLPLLAGAVGAVCGAVLPAAQAADAQPVARSFAHTVKARGIAEECFQLPADGSVAYVFEATGPVDFNVHFHRGSDVEYAVKLEQVRQAGARLVAPSAQEFCLMWRNRTAAPLAVSGTLSP